VSTVSTVILLPVASSESRVEDGEGSEGSEGPGERSVNNQVSVCNFSYLSVNISLH
jgi:hypothetical protein